MFSMDMLLQSTSATEAGRSDPVPQPRRRARTSFTPSALTMMETEFQTNQYPDISRREEMASQIKVPESRVQVWFQNRRARLNKRKRSTETMKPVKLRHIAPQVETVENKMSDCIQNSRLPVCVSNGNHSVTSASPVFARHVLGVDFRIRASADHVTWFSACNSRVPSPTSTETRVDQSDVERFLQGMFRFSAPSDDSRRQVAVARKPYVMTVPAKRVNTCSVVDLQTTDIRMSDSVVLSADKPSVNCAMFEEQDSGFVLDSSCDSL